MLTGVGLFRSMTNEEQNKAHWLRGQGMCYVILSLFQNSITENLIFQRAAFSVSTCTYTISWSYILKIQRVAFTVYLFCLISRRACNSTVDSKLYLSYVNFSCPLS